MSAAGDVGVDLFDARIAQGAPPLLAQFNAIGLLSAADVHVAQRIAVLTGEGDDAVLLAAALAVRGPRLGHVFVDLATIASTASVESEEPVDLSGLPWPATPEWVDAVRASPLVAVGEADDVVDRPLRLVGSHVYLDRYWREERRVAEDLLALSESATPDVDIALLGDGLRRLFAVGSDPLQRVAAAVAVLRRFAVVGGGPGTGKTTTVARIVALAAEQAAARGARPPLVALAAPTGKAAARLQEAIHDEVGRLDTGEEIKALVGGLQASTVHRLLGWRPGSHSRFAHDRDNRLPHELVIVDETSMISLSLMARLVEAVRADAGLILVGDPGQLTSIEAGVVLGDIVGPAATGLRMSTSGARVVASASGVELGSAPGDRPGGTIGDGIVVLERVYRYGASIAELADAIRAGDADAAIDVLRGDRPEITWLPSALEDGPATDAALAPVRARALATGRAVLDAARAGDATRALRALSEFRLLCAHRRGPYGVSTWTRQLQAWLSDEVDGLDLEQRDYAGRPLLITENDYELGLYNGDTGVIVEGEDGQLTAVFERGGELLRFSPLRLGWAETVYAMTIHKSQGSQFGTVAILLPPPSSPILTRELLYTAVTRARSGLILVGDEVTVRLAIERPVARASGLRARLWGDESARL